jgi:hypothetical protein
MAKKLSITILLALCLWGISGSMVLAQQAQGPNPEGLVTCGRDSSAPKIGPDGKALPLAQNCDFIDLIAMINRIINYLIVIATALSAIAFAYAGWLYLSAGDNTGQVTKARTIFMDVAIGFVIILSGWLLFRLIADNFLSDAYKNAVFLNKSN